MDMPQKLKKLENVGFDEHGHLVFLQLIYPMMAELSENDRFRYQIQYLELLHKYVSEKAAEKRSSVQPSAEIIPPQKVKTESAASSDLDEIVILDWYILNYYYY